MSPDFDKAMTGYRWLDWVLAPILNPYNAVATWIIERKLDRSMGIHGTTRERREQRYRIFREVRRLMDDEGNP